MEAMEAIMTRRSIRRYTGKQVSPELERKLLEAGMAAPSAHNGQPWHFIVVRSRETLDRVPEFHPYSKMLREASLAVVVWATTRSRQQTSGLRTAARPPRTCSSPRTPSA